MAVKRILKKIVNTFSEFNRKPQSEEEFYEDLFIINDSWNKPSPNFDELKRWEVIEYFIKRINLHKDSNILDLGCGRGWLSNLLSSYGIVVGIEPVVNVLKYAKHLFPHINFVAGKASSLLNNYTKKFDLIVSSEVIEHIPDDEKEAFVNEIRMLLKIDGYSIISTPRKDAQKDWLKYSNLKQPIEEWISERELRDLFENNGFKMIEIKRIPRKPRNKPDLVDLYQVCLFQKKSE